jgi:hypothetical protein
MQLFWMKTDLGATVCRISGSNWFEVREKQVFLGSGIVLELVLKKSRLRCGFGRGFWAIAFSRLFYWADSHATRRP